MISLQICSVISCLVPFVLIAKGYREHAKMKESNYSLGDELYKDLVTPNDVGSTGLIAYFHSSIATSDLISAISDPPSIKQSWLSLLAIPGTIMFHESTGLREVYYVLEATRHGVVGWCATAQVVPDQRLIVLTQDTVGPRWKYIHIRSLTGWYCQDVESVPPALCKGTLRGKTRGIVLTCASSKSLPLLKFSAQHAFKSMTVTFMKDLLKFLAVPCDGGTYDSCTHFAHSEDIIPVHINLKVDSWTMQ